MNTITDKINSMSTADLLNLKSFIEDKIDEYYNLPDNFYLHEKTDDYIYIVDYEDGSFHYTYKGADAYREYTNDLRAVGIRRKTKDLFPKYETMIKENYERKQKAIRQELCYKPVQTDNTYAEPENRLGYYRLPRYQRQQEWIS